MTNLQLNLRLTATRGTVAVIVTCLSGCLAGSSGRTHDPNESTMTPRSAIFSATRTRELFQRVGRCDGVPFQAVDDVWTPSEAEVAQLKGELYEAFDAQKPTASVLSGRDYSFQFFGVVVEGRRLIYVNAVHAALLERMTRNSETEWFDRPIVICDAGLGGFQAEYDVSTAELGAIRFASTYGSVVPP